MDKPKVITIRKPLPFDALSPDDFERLCFWLIESEGYSGVQHLGDAGGDQGRDVIGYKGQALTYFQCKRYQQISSATLTKEVDKYVDLIASDPAKRPEQIIFVTNARVSASIRDNLKKYCAERDLVCDFWARTELDYRVKKYDDIVHEFFDAANSGVVFNGDFYQLVVPHYPALKDYVYDFKDLITSTTRWFVGREYVFASLTEFQTTHDCGYFRITADAGLGKTALAAEIAKRKTAPAFFANESSGLTRPDQCLNHLSSVLIARFGLEHDYLPPRSGDDSLFFSKILAESVERSNEAVWIVVDGLDEADSSKGGNTLLLPDHLPNGVYVVLTQRPGEYPLVTKSSTTSIVDCVVGWDDAGQQSDIREHLFRQSQRGEVREALDRVEPPISVAKFVEVLQESSEGNFKYLDYVLADVIAREPGFDPLKPENLPKGLKGYYGQFWARMETAKDTYGWSDWKTLFRQVIALLAVAREPVNLNWLADHTGRDKDEIRERVLTRWRRFLSSSHKTWRIVHQSFSDFLAEKLDLPPTHGTVASFYLDSPARWNSHNGYANRHLTGHLRLASQSDALFSLVDDRSWYQAQIGSDASGGTYITDLNQAWLAAEEANLSLLREHKTPTFIGRELRCALAVTSLRSFSTNLPSSLPWLFKSGLWNVAAAFESIRQNPSAETQAEALAAIAPFLLMPQLTKAVVLARSFEELSLQEKALDRLLPRLAELGHDVEAFDEVLRSSENSQVKVLIRLAPILSESLLRKALARVERIKFVAQKRNEQGNLDPDMFELGEWDVVSLTRLAQLGYWSEAVSATQAIPPAFWRARTVASIAKFLPTDVRERLLNEALASLQTIAFPENHAQAAGELANCLPAKVRSQLIHQAFNDTKSDDFWRARALRVLAPYLDIDLLDEALIEMRAMKEHDASTAAEGLIPRLAELGFSQTALDTLNVIKYEPDRGKVLGSLGPYLPEPKLREALKRVQLFESKENQANALAGLLPALSDLGHSQEALTFARLIGDREACAKTIAEMTFGVSVVGYPEKVLELVRTIELPHWQARALIWLAPTLNESVTREALTLVHTIEQKLRNTSRRRGSPVDWLWTMGALTELSMRLADLGFSEEAFERVRLIHEETDRAEALARLGPHLSEPFRSQALQESIKNLTSTESVRALSEILPHLSEPLLKELLGIIRSFHFERSRADALRHLILYLPKPLLFEALECTLDFEYEVNKLHVRMDAIVRLAELNEFEESLQLFGQH